MNKQFKYLKTIIRDLFSKEFAEFYIKEQFFNYTKLHDELIAYLKKIKATNPENVEDYYINFQKNSTLRIDFKNILQKNIYQTIGDPNLPKY